MIRHQHEVTINQGSCIVYITEKPAQKRAQGTTFGLFVEAIAC